MIVGKNEKSNWTKIGLIDPIFCTFKFGSLTRPIQTPPASAKSPLILENSGFEFLLFNLFFVYIKST
jgi:hypothetical protein